MTRQSPIGVDHIYYDYRAADADGGNLEVELRIVRREIIDPLLETCRSAGIAVAGCGS